MTLAGPARPRVGGEMSELGIIEDGALLIVGEKIAAVGPRAQVEALAPPEAHRIDASGGVVLPGLVDAHTHPIFAGDRADEFEQRTQGLSYEEIARRGGGILSTVRRTRQATDAELLALASRHRQWFIEHGTTTLEAKSGYGLTVEDELKLLRVIRQLHEQGPLELVPTLLAAHIVPPEQSHNRSEYIRLITESLLPRVAAEGLAEFHDVYCDRGAFTLEETRALMAAAVGQGFKLRLHAEQWHRTGASHLAAEFRARTADHLEKITDEDISALARSGTLAVLLPGSVFALGRHDYPPARKLIEAGVPVVVATDFNPGTSPTPNMQMVLTLSCTQMGMTPAEALTAATINAAYSLDRGHRVGSLEVGKQADVVIMKCSDYRQIPYFFGVNHVARVIKRGRLVYPPP